MHGPFSHAFKNVYHVKALVSLVMKSIQDGIVEGDSDCMQCSIMKKRMRVAGANPSDDGETGESDAEARGSKSKTAGQWKGNATKKKWQNNKKKAPQINGNASVDASMVQSKGLESKAESPTRESISEHFYYKEQIFIDLHPFNHLASLRMFGCSKKGEFRPLVVDECYPLPPIVNKIAGEELRYLLFHFSHLGKNLEEKLFKLTAVNWVPPTTPLLTFPDSAFLKAVTSKMVLFRFDSFIQAIGV